MSRYDRFQQPVEAIKVQRREPPPKPDSRRSSDTRKSKASWHIENPATCPASKPWAVVKDADKTVVGCHETEADANRQMAALYANEPKAVVMTMPGLSGPIDVVFPLIGQSDH